MPKSRRDLQPTEDFGDVWHKLSWDERTLLSIVLVLAIAFASSVVLALDFALESALGNSVRTCISRTVCIF